MQDGARFSITIEGSDVIEILDIIYSKAREDASRELSQKQAQEESYISKAEVMSLLRKSENTLWKWGKRGYLVPVKHGGSVMYRRSEVMAILNGRTLCEKEERSGDE